MVANAEASCLPCEEDEEEGWERRQRREADIELVGTRSSSGTALRCPGTLCRDLVSGVAEGVPRAKSRYVGGDVELVYDDWPPSLILACPDDLAEVHEAS